MATVGRPARLGLVLVAVGQLRGRARGCVDEPHMPALPRRETHAVEFVIRAGDVAERDAQFLLRLVLFTFQRVEVFLAELAHQLRPVGRPFEIGEAALQVGQRPGLAAVKRDEVNLGLLLAAAIGEEGDGLAVGRPARPGVGPFAVGERTQAVTVGLGQPQIGVLLLRLSLHALHGEDDALPAGGDLRVGGDVEAVEVIGRSDLRGRRCLRRGRGLGISHGCSLRVVIWSQRYHVLADLTGGRRGGDTSLSLS